MRLLPGIRTRASCIPFPGAFAAVVALTIGAAACSDRSAPLAVPEPPRTPVMLGAVQCNASVAGRKLSCNKGTLPSSARGYVIVGGQHSFIEISTNNVAYNPSAGEFTFSLSIGNLLAQPMGTADGVTPDPEGVRVVVAGGPVVFRGSGSVTVNGDGTGAFTAAGQPFYRYAGAALGSDGVLSRLEVALPRSWALNVPPTVVEFGFVLYVVAEVPYPNGYIDLSPGSGGAGDPPAGPPGGGAPAADTVLAGTAGSLRAVVRSAAGTPLPQEPLTWSSSNPAVATVNASGGFTAVAPGSATLTATGAGRSGKLVLQVCPDLGVGGVYVSTDPAMCIGTGAAAAEYTVMAVNLSAAAAQFSAAGTGLVPVSGPPTPVRAPGVVAPPPVRDDGFHLRLLERMRGLQPTLDTRVKPGARTRRNIVPGVPKVGDAMDLNVAYEPCATAVHRATVKAVGTHAIVMEDDGNPAGGFTSADYADILADFDGLVFPAVTGAFGTPHDQDGNGRVIILFTYAVNQLTTDDRNGVIVGFFSPRDLYPTSACAGSNLGEMFYMLAPDPDGEKGTARSVSFVREGTVGVTAHEFQHLINGSRRWNAPTRAPFEESWLNEGLSHVAEEEVYYAHSHHAAGQNLAWGVIGDPAHPSERTSFDRFARQNFDRLETWLREPHGNGPFAANDQLPTRGAIWSFLRYAADRKGGAASALWTALAGGPELGLANLHQRLGSDPLPWFRDWATATYLDDAVAGSDAVYTLPSWNFRSIYGTGLGVSLPLGVWKPGTGTPAEMTLAGGAGTAYVRMGVPAAAFAGVTTTAPSPTLSVVVMRTR